MTLRLPVSLPASLTSASGKSGEVQLHPNGLPASYTLGNTMTYLQTLNSRQWPELQETKLGTALLQKYVYTYSDAGDLTVFDDQADGSDDATFGYDDLHRLTNATGIWGAYVYGYDPLHNLRTRTGPGALTYSYNGFNQLSGISGGLTRTYGYNSTGEATGDGIRAFTVSAHGQISAITGVATYTYDGNGRRIKVAPASGSAEYTLYDRAGALVYTEKGTTKTDYLALNGQSLVKLEKVGSTTTVSYLHPDLLGSPRKESSASGGLSWQEHYEPYGKKMNGVAGKIGYTGHAHDAESGYTYMQARFYDPQVGRFLSPDPVHFQDGNPFSFNRYAYANDNPYRYTDPTGMCGTGTHIKGKDAINCTVVGGALGSQADGAGNSASKGQRQASTVGEASGAQAEPNLWNRYLAWRQGNFDRTEALLDAAMSGNLEAQIELAMGFVGGTGNVSRAVVGHSFEKHVLGVGARLDDPLFRGLGIRTTAQLARHVDEVLRNPTAVRSLRFGRVAYWHEATSSVLIHNPLFPSRSTILQPSAGRAYFEGLR